MFMQFISFSMRFVNSKYNKANTKIKMCMCSDCAAARALSSYCTHSLHQLQHGDYFLIQPAVVKRSSIYQVFYILYYICVYKCVCVFFCRNDISRDAIFFNNEHGIQPQKAFRRKSQSPPIRYNNNLGIYIIIKLLLQCYV